MTGNMARSNIERFDEITAQTLAKLYENFPVPIALTVGQFGVEITEENWDDPQALSDAEFVVSTHRWLCDAGYINLGDVRPPIGVFDAVLTAKGLEVLKAIPGSIGGQTIGDRLIEGVKAGGKEIAKEALKEALSYGSRLLLGG